jgi:hypothetical protein
MASAAEDSDTAAEVDAKCHLLTLPSELIRQILSLVLPYASSEVHAIRAVCRTFRYAANQLPFWYEDGFSFKALWDGMYSSRNIASPMDTILDDAHLRECLGRKTNWFHLENALFRVLYDRLPYMSDVTERLAFDYRDYRYSWGTPVTLEHLKNLEFLELRMWNVPTTINKLPVSIRTLHIESHVLSFAGLYGIANLEEFHFCGISRFNPTFDIWRWLPIRSSKTLSKLSLTVPFSNDDPQFCALDSLINVKMLVFKTSHPAFFDYLSHSRLKLDSLSLTWHPFAWHVEIGDKIAESLQRSPALQNLWTLYLCFEDSYRDNPVYDPFFSRMWEPIIPAIINLPCLVSMHLDFPIDLDWCQYFARCTKRLEQIRWSIPANSKQSQLEIHARLMTYLQHLDPTPSVTIEVPKSYKDYPDDDSYMDYGDSDYEGSDYKPNDHEVSEYENYHYSLDAILAAFS